jgi:hypothetical protein
MAGNRMAGPLRSFERPQARGGNDLTRWQLLLQVEGERARQVVPEELSGAFAQPLALGGYRFQLLVGRRVGAPAMVSALSLRLKHATQGRLDAPARGSSKMHNNTINVSAGVGVKTWPRA